MTADVSPFSIRLSYTYADVYENRNNGSRRTLPFVPKHRVLSVLHASTADDAWQATLTTEWRGAQQLPQTGSYPTPYQMAERSDPYTLMHLHLQRSWESFDFYVGVENLFDYRQRNPIINPARPFERYFEPGFAWGPVKGREAYAGIRTRISVL
jgi:outer membrane receptor for ferrienterochelin and colicin